MNPTASAILTEMRSRSPRFIRRLYGVDGPESRGARFGHPVSTVFTHASGCDTNQGIRKVAAHAIWAPFRAANHRVGLGAQSPPAFFSRTIFLPRQSDISDSAARDVIACGMNPQRSCRTAGTTGRTLVTQLIPQVLRLLIRKRRSAVEEKQ
jgi:hypothetical protein